MTNTQKQMAQTRLTEGVVCLRYQKADGTIRDIHATLRADKMPATEATKAARSNDQMQAVWDTQKSEWRSVRWERVLSWSNLQP
jgi:hypothetical protein